MTLHPIHFDFLRPFCEEAGVFVDDPADASAVLTMNQVGAQCLEHIREAKAVADKYGIPLCYWTIEDPNSYGFTIHQAQLADYIFTSDGALLERYRQDLGHERVYWLPLAASETYHRPLPLAEDAADFVASLNFYDYWPDGRPRNQARIWGTETVLLPLARAGYSIVIFSYAEPPYPELKGFWRGDGGGCRKVAEQYTHGRVVLGNNNQRSGMDGIERTLMTSMRTFEALACGKPFLAPWSDAYEVLLFCPGLWLDFAVVDSSHTAALDVIAEGMIRLESPNENAQGRRHVLAGHTYTHRMRTILEAIA